ncbi:MAG: response regulator transcription factor, partial [Thermodesulfobacteriota bacterium]
LWFRRTVLEKFISEQLFFCRLKESAKQEFIPPTFTRRELEIIQMAGKGVKNREIGRNLFISEKTVKHHLSKIFKKLQIRKKGELRIYL